MGAITLRFVTCSDPGSWAIRTFQRGWCSHVDSVMDDGRLLGARLDGGVAIRPPNYEKFSRVERVVISVPYYKERAYWDFLKAQVADPAHGRKPCHARTGLSNVEFSDNRLQNTTNRLPLDRPKRD